jgi:hypothetical protein
MAFSTNLCGPCSERYEAIPHAGHKVFFQDRTGRGWSTFFDSDATAPRRERPGILPFCFDEQARIRPE